METKPECHIAPSAADGNACPCQGDADVMLVVKHHHTPDGGCEEVTVSMCRHHYYHYLQGIAEVILVGVITGDTACRRCGNSFEDAADIFERVV